MPVDGALFFNLIWLFFLFSALLPMLHQRRLEQARVRIIRSLEEKRGSRVITLIHREEALSFLGIPLRRFITIEDSEQILRAIRLTPDDLPIDIILHTPGGLVLAAEQIAHAIRKHKAKVTVFVPHYAMSGGTLIALAADEIVMDENAVLGPVDPQLGNYPAASILRVVEQKDKNELEDATLIMADIAAKAVTQLKLLVMDILSAKMEEAKAAEITEALTSGQWTHDYPITVDKLEKLGLPVTVGLPREVYQLMELYPQSPQRRPSVWYIPVPYRGRRGGAREQEE
ncbi:MAG: ATP-dependent Clp protease proteolytic subunit [Thermogemmatispora sp.]|uniref:SDH family Clp fold serine proteinase n=1 Tax=Thermogemmatispora sp. TaxID=1968838 RepID=UPI0019F7563F|nr:ATP-dependent Clp protease proteolytic subunit [Thermogemmatispora sp.]MBE3565817.1 ATP-dependent Clp protease proteolytic subunit [Thermogemmatispora sp.]